MADPAAGSPDQSAAKRSKRLLRSLEGDHKLVAQWLYDLAKCARSFSFYDANNEAIRKFLDELGQDNKAFMEDHDQLRLVVGADRFVYESKAVYFDSDREHGLPFKLFRDGVRSVTFAKTFSQDELEQFLNVLAKRPSTGRTAEEEDISTLLWKMNLPSVRCEVVEGFTQDIAGVQAALADEEEDEPEEQSEYLAMPGTSEAFDRLLAALGGQLQEPEDQTLYPGSDDYHELAERRSWGDNLPAITEQEQAAIRRELDYELTYGVVQLLDSCFQLAMLFPHRFGPDNFRPLMLPIRRFVLRERALGVYLEYVRYLRFPPNAEAHSREMLEEAREILQESATREAMAGVLAIANEESTSLTHLAGILALMGAVLKPDILLDLLGGVGREEAAEVVARSIVESLKGDLTIVKEAASSEDERAAIAGLRCLAADGDAGSIELVEAALGHAEASVRQHALRTLHGMPSSENLNLALGMGLRDAHPSVRQEALGAIERIATAPSAQVLAKWFAEDGFDKLEPGEREQAVRMIATLDPRNAARYFADKIQVSMRARFGARLGSGRVNEWNHLAVKGLAWSGNPQARAKLVELREKGSAEFQELIKELLAELQSKGTS